jgi:hypothetical protein
MTLREESVRHRAPRFTSVNEMGRSVDLRKPSRFSRKTPFYQSKTGLSPLHRLIGEAENPKSRDLRRKRSTGRVAVILRDEAVRSPVPLEGALEATTDGPKGPPRGDRTREGEVASRRDQGGASRGTECQQGSPVPEGTRRLECQSHNRPRCSRAHEVRLPRLAVA